MKTIWQALRDGDAKSRLAVVADLVSIVGVSVASVVAAMFATNSTLIWSQVFGFTVIGLLSLAGALIVLVGFLVVSFYISAMLADHRTIRGLLLAAWWLAFAALFLLATLYTYDALVHTPFTK